HFRGFGRGPGYARPRSDARRGRAGPVARELGALRHSRTGRHRLPAAGRARLCEAAAAMVSGHAYPWDVLGDPGFLDGSRERVPLAASYPSTRAATPLHPAHQIVEARWAALYRPTRSAAWKGQDLRPLEPDWAGGPDAFGEAAAVLKRAG